VLKSTTTISSPIEGEGKNGNSRERLLAKIVEFLPHIFVIAMIGRAIGPD
jgi:hypothetical protein